ncbi:MAG: hypothetical protein MZU91_06070 [Desulfosudis oleivorans]|nr:hypothetical protein [Desulfosudis oleivorans]
MRYFNENAQHQSNKMAFEYVPEVEIAGQVERYASDVMYDMRGYGLTEDNNFLKMSQESMVKLDKALKRRKRPC